MSSSVSMLLLGRFMYQSEILCHFSACFIAFFVFVLLHSVSSDLGVYGIVSGLDVAARFVLKISPGLCITSQLILW